MSRLNWLSAIAIFLCGPGSAGPLHDAAKLGDIGSVDRLIADGADVDEIDFFAGSPLHAAALGGHVEVARRLIDAGADINLREFNNDETPLHQAAIGGSPEMIRFLVRAGAELEAKGDKDFTPLHKAIYIGKAEAALALIDLGADVTAPTQFGFSPLHLAGEAWLPDVLQRLRAAGAEPVAPEPVEAMLGEADPERGALLYAEHRCKSCHDAREASLTRGPDLAGVVGREIGSVDGYAYSHALSAEEGRWDNDALNRLLADAMNFFPGTKMISYGNIVRIESVDDRADLIAYLSLKSDNVARREEGLPLGYGQARSPR